MFSQQYNKKNPHVEISREISKEQHIQILWKNKKSNSNKAFEWPDIISCHMKVFYALWLAWGEMLTNARWLVENFLFFCVMVYDFAIEQEIWSDIFNYQFWKNW